MVDLEVLAQQLDLVMVGQDDHIVPVLHRRNLAKHPNFQIQSEGSQDQQLQFSSSHEAMMQVTQHLDWQFQFQTMWYPVAINPPNAPGPLLSKILHGLTTQLLRLVTLPLLVVQLPTLLLDQGEPV